MGSMRVDRDSPEMRRHEQRMAEEAREDRENPQAGLLRQRQRAEERRRVQLDLLRSSLDNLRSVIAAEEEEDHKYSEGPKRIAELEAKQKLEREQIEKRYAIDLEGIERRQGELDKSRPAESGQ